MHIVFCIKNLKRRDHYEDLGVDGENNIIMDLREIGWEDVDWTHLAQDRDQWRTVVNTVMGLGVPLKAGNFLFSWVIISFSKTSLLHGVGWLVLGCCAV
jgi:hypothetical protein